MVIGVLRGNARRIFTWSNTIDNTLPTSDVAFIADLQLATFPVQWSGSDVGAGLQDLTVYVSDNGAPFTRIASLLSHDWERLYGHPVYFAETFIDPERFRGTCYRAANWTVLGLTTGRGKDSTSKRPNRSLKEVLGYPLTPRFRELLSQS